MPEITNKEDVKLFIESSPVAEDIDLLSKAELIVVASYLELTVSDMSKPEIAQIRKSELFGIHEGGEHDGAEGGEPNGAAGGGLGNGIQMWFGDNLPEGFTPEQYLELAKLTLPTRVSY